MTTSEALECGCDLESCMFCGDNKETPAATPARPAVRGTFSARESETTQSSPQPPFKRNPVFSKQQRDTLAQLCAPNADKFADQSTPPVIRFSQFASTPFKSRIVDDWASDQ